MTNTLHMKEQSESQKNARAGGYTALVLVLLLVIFLFVKWSLPPLPQPPVEEGMEVNLGNSDLGLGNDQPFEPGSPAPQDKQAYVPPQPVVAKEEPVKDIATDDKDEEAPEIKKPPVTKPEATKVPDKEVVKTKPVTKPKPVDNPAPPAPKPKAVFKGTNGTSTGGNDADSYKKGGSEGIAGGNGDQGRPGGNPDSKNYTGGGKGNTGMKVVGLTGRHLTYVHSFKDDFNENATVVIDVRVDKNGNVISATYQLRGSSTSEAFYKEKAIDAVKKSKFNASPNGADEQTGSVVVSFKVRG